MSSDIRKKTLSGFGPVPGKKPDSQAGNESQFGSGLADETQQWLNTITLHHQGLQQRLAQDEYRAPDAKISQNPVVRIERVFKNFFGSDALLLNHCSENGKTLDPAMFFEYLCKAFAAITKILESRESKAFFDQEKLTRITGECQRYLCFMASVLPEVGRKFEQYAADNGGVVLGPLAPLQAPRARATTQPYMAIVKDGTAQSATEEAPVSSNVVPPSSRRSSVPVSADELYAKRIKPDTVRPPTSTKRGKTLVGLGEMAQQVQSYVAKPPQITIPGGSDTTDRVITSILPPPMAGESGFESSEHDLQTLKRKADKEFEKLFAEEYENYLQEYVRIHEEAERLFATDSNDPNYEKNFQEAEALASGLSDLMKDPEEIALTAFDLALEKMEANPDQYTHFTSYYLEGNRLDYREQFSQLVQPLFAKKSREFVDVHLPVLLEKLVTDKGLKRDLRLHQRELKETASEAVPEHLRTIAGIIDQIATNDPLVLYEEWPDRLAAALATLTFMKLNTALYRAKKSELIWGLYFFQESKRELADSVYQPIFDAYLPLCQAYQDELRDAVRNNVADVTAKLISESGVMPVVAEVGNGDQNVPVPVPDDGTVTYVGEEPLTVEEYEAIGKSLDEVVIAELNGRKWTAGDQWRADHSDTPDPDEGFDFSPLLEDRGEVHDGPVIDVGAPDAEISFSDLGVGDLEDLSAEAELLPDAPSSGRISFVDSLLDSARKSYSDITIRELFTPPKETVLNNDEALFQTVIAQTDGVVMTETGLPPLPEVIDPLTDSGNDKLFIKLINDAIRSPDKVTKFKGYALSIGTGPMSGIVLAKDGWIVIQDKKTENIEFVGDDGRVHEKNSDRTFGTWYFRPPSTLIPVRRPAAFTDDEREQFKQDDAPLTMTIEEMKAYLNDNNQVPRAWLKALYTKSFADGVTVEDPFKDIPDDQQLFALKPKSDDVQSARTEGKSDKSEASFEDTFVHLPSAKELYGEMNEGDRVTLLTPDTVQKRQRARALKYIAGAAAAAAMSVLGASVYKTHVDHSDTTSVASSASNSDTPKTPGSAKVAEVLSAQPAPSVTAPIQQTQPSQPSAPVVSIENLPTRTYVSDDVLRAIPSDFTRKVVETGIYTVEPNGLGWVDQVAIPFTRIASVQQLKQITDLKHKLNVGLYAKYIRKYENAANVNAILMNPSHPEYKTVKYLMKPNVMGNPYDWDWKVFTRNTGKSWNVEQALSYYETFEKEAFERDMDKHSPGLLHMGAWGGDKIEVYKAGKFMSYMVDVAGIVGIDLTPPKSGSLDPSHLHDFAPGVPHGVPGFDQPGVPQNKTGFLSPSIPTDIHFGAGLGSHYGELPRFAFAPTNEHASYDENKSEIQKSSDDLSVDVDLSELNAPDEVAYDVDLSDLEHGGDLSVDVDLSELETQDDVDSQWETIAAQHEAQKQSDVFSEKVASVKKNRREALTMRGEVFVPPVSIDMNGSAMLAFENGFLKECTSESQQQRVRAILSKVRLSSLEEYEVMEDGSTFAKLSEKDLRALNEIVQESSLEDQLAEVDAGWDIETDSTETLVTDVSRKVNIRLGTVELSA